MVTGSTAAGGAGGRINPLHIRSVPAGDEDEDQGLGSLALHMKTLDIFFGLYLPGAYRHAAGVAQGSAGRGIPETGNHMGDRCVGAVRRGLSGDERFI